MVFDTLREFIEFYKENEEPKLIKELRYYEHITLDVIIDITNWLKERGTGKAYICLSCLTHDRERIVSYAKEALKVEGPDYLHAYYVILHAEYMTENGGPEGYAKLIKYGHKILKEDANFWYIDDCCWFMESMYLDIKNYSEAFRYHLRQGKKLIKEDEYGYDANYYMDKINDFDKFLEILRAEYDPPIGINFIVKMLERMEQMEKKILEYECLPGIGKLFLEAQADFREKQ